MPISTTEEDLIISEVEVLFNQTTCSKATEEDLIISEVEVLFNQTTCSKATEDKKKVTTKLHQQFAHLKKEKIIQLIKDSGKEDEELFKCITDIENECKVCKRYRKPKL